MNYFSAALVSVLLLISPSIQAAEASMKQMPTIKPKTSYTVQTNEKGEDLLDQRGFGDQEASVKMMNLMMVEGSGYEGMDMNSMTKMEGKSSHTHSAIAANDSDPSKTTNEKSASAVEMSMKTEKVNVGANVLNFSVKKDLKPAKKMNLKAQVFMTSMDMGTEEPRVREVSPGEYQVKAVFSMKGPWAVKIISSEGEKVFNFEVGAKP